MVIYIIDKRKEIKIQKRLKEYRQYLNEKKIDFLIHINHELRTPLTLIYAPLKRLIDKKEYKESPQYLMSQFPSYAALGWISIAIVTSDIEGNCGHGAGLELYGSRLQ